MMRAGPGSMAEQHPEGATRPGSIKSVRLLAEDKGFDIVWFQGARGENLTRERNGNMNLIYPFE